LRSPTGTTSQEGSEPRSLRVGERGSVSDYALDVLRDLRCGEIPGRFFSCRAIAAAHCDGFGGSSLENRSGHANQPFLGLSPL